MIFFLFSAARLLFFQCLFSHCPLFNTDIWTQEACVWLIVLVKGVHIIIDLSSHYYDQKANCTIQIMAYFLAIIRKWGGSNLANTEKHPPCRVLLCCLLIKKLIVDWKHVLSTSKNRATRLPYFTEQRRKYVSLIKFLNVALWFLLLKVGLYTQ